MTSLPCSRAWWFSRPSDAPAKTPWVPFSQEDTARLEQAYGRGATGTVAVRSSLGDVDLATRTCTPAYSFAGTSEVVQRSFWFQGALRPGDHANVDKASKLVPVDEILGDILEQVFYQQLWLQAPPKPTSSSASVSLDKDPRVVRLPEIPGHKKRYLIVFYAIDDILLVPDDLLTQTSSNLVGLRVRGEPLTRSSEYAPLICAAPVGNAEAPMRHLVLFVHGIGQRYFANLETEVTTMRTIMEEMYAEHFGPIWSKQRLQLLPVEWRSDLALSSIKTTLPEGVNEGNSATIEDLTLPASGSLRRAANDILLDILYYTSSRHCQLIVDHLTDTLNRTVETFLSRHPNFTKDGGKISIVGHSLGSVLSFDIVSHQKYLSADGTESYARDESDDIRALRLKIDELQRLLAEKERAQQQQAEAAPVCPETSLPESLRDQLKAIHRDKPIHYRPLTFHTHNLYLVGSPVGLFLALRGATVGPSGTYAPLCDNFFNIFHPYDPIAYRIEPIVSQSLAATKPFCVPHHKSRSGKRVHYAVDDAIQKGKKLFSNVSAFCRQASRSVVASASESSTEKDAEHDVEQQKKALSRATDEQLAPFNSFHRLDFALQEPMGANAYVGALGAHVSYNSSKDTCLFILAQLFPQVSASKPESETADEQ